MKAKTSSSLKTHHSWWVNSKMEDGLSAAETIGFIQILKEQI